MSLGSQNEHSVLEVTISKLSDKFNEPGQVSLWGVNLSKPYDGAEVAASEWAPSLGENHFHSNLSDCGPAAADSKNRLLGSFL